MKAKVDTEECAELYEGNWSVAELAERYGVNRSRIYDALRKQGVARRDDRQGPRERPTRCARSHQFTPENTRVDRMGYWHCRECERIYSLLYYATRGQS